MHALEAPEVENGRGHGSDVDAKSPAVQEDIEELQAITCPTFCLVAAFPASLWIDTAVNRCLASSNDGTMKTRESCGLALLWAAMFTLVAGYGVVGVYRERRRAPGLSTDDHSDGQSHR